MIFLVLNFSFKNIVISPKKCYYIKKDGCIKFSYNGFSRDEVIEIPDITSYHKVTKIYFEKD